MTGDGDRFLPCADRGLNSLHHNRSTEYGSVQDRTDRSIGAFPHFLQMIFAHAGRIGGNGGTLYRHSILLRCKGGIHRHLVIRLVSMDKSKIVIFGIQVNIGKQKLLLDHFPENPCHLIAVHLHKRRCHLNFFHLKVPPHPCQCRTSVYCEWYLPHVLWQVPPPYPDPVPGSPPGSSGAHG